VVGSAIADRLLTNPANRLTLLVRADSEEHLEARLSDLFRFWKRDASALRHRVVGVRGDTSLPHFGLTAHAFDELARACTHVVHCAALVRMNLPLQTAQRASIGATENVVQLAERAREHGTLRKVEYLSTVGVGGRRSQPLPERLIDEPRAFHNTYEQAKAEAETLLAGAMAAGLPVTLYRPSMVVGDSRTGRVPSFQIFYHLVEFLTGTRTLGLFPAFGRARLDLVPVDFVATAVAWSSEQASTTGRILHLCSGPQGSIPVRELQDVVRRSYLSAGRRRLPPVIALPSELFRAAMQVVAAFSSAKLKRAIATLPIFLDYLADEQSFENRETSRLLQQHGIALPPVESYLDRVLDYYFAARQENPVRR
jgi:thioester reductase-like protein